MSDQATTRRDLSKLRTIPLDDATHRRLRLYCHGLHEDGEAGETMARVAGEAIEAWLDAKDAPPTRQARTPAEIAAGILTEYRPEIERAKAAIRAMAEREAGDPSEGAGEM